MAIFLIEVMIVNEAYKPELFDISKAADYKQFSSLIQQNPHLLIYDELASQIEDLVKCRRPDIHATGDKTALREEVVKFMKSINFDRYGIWVYYPWSARAVHILPENEFVEVRTNRNKMKITQTEQEDLAKKAVGVIGLSVGQSVALTLAIERVAGEIRIADFDQLELSNLNRIRSGIFNLGLNKAVLVAREIAEMDPFINVRVFTDGITDANIETFLTEGGKLDLVHEECDDIYIKVLAREKARKYGIPVIMEASDKCTVDIERFDLDQNRPLMHGLMGEISSNDLKNLGSRSESIALMLDMVGIDNLSARVKASITEIGHSSGTWPQLASAVMMGGAITTDLTRQVLLGHFNHSGRYQVDLDEIFEIPNPGSLVDMGILKKEEYTAITEKYLRSHPMQISEIPAVLQSIKVWIEQLYYVKEANGHIFLFSRDNKPGNKARNESVIVAGFIGQLINGDETVIESFPVPGHPDLVAVIRSMDSEFTQPERTRDYYKMLRDLKPDPKNMTGHPPLAEIRASLFSTFGVAQLCGNLNPYLGPYPKSELSLRLIRQRGVASLLNKWELGKGVDAILKEKLSPFTSHRIEVTDNPGALVELGRAIAKEHTTRNVSNTILFLYIKNVQEGHDKDGIMTIAFGIGPAKESENQNENDMNHSLTASNIRDNDSNPNSVSDL